MAPGPWVLQQCPQPPTGTWRGRGGPAAAAWGDPDPTETPSALGRGGAGRIQGKHGGWQRVAKALALVLVFLPWFLGSSELCLLGCWLSCFGFDSL